MPPARKTRCQCITINNPTEQDYKLFDDWASEAAEAGGCAVRGFEKGKKTGTPHIQGYIKFPNARSFNSWQKFLPRAHLEDQWADCDSCPYNYCLKDNTDIKEWGTPPKPDEGQGHRSDLVRVRECLEDGGCFEDILDITMNPQCHRAALTWLSIKERKRNWIPKVLWFWGKSGTGKTEAAYSIAAKLGYTRIWESNKDGQWWDGYDAHPVAILDDLRDNWCEYSELLRILDSKPYRIAIKGSFRQLLAEVIIITSPYHPKELYSYGEDTYQLVRRCTRIKQFGTGTEVVEGNSEASTTIAASGGVHGLRPAGPMGI